MKASLNMTASDLLPKDIADHFNRSGLIVSSMAADDVVTGVVDWLVGQRSRRNRAVCRYLSYLNRMWETFVTIAQDFPRQNPGRAGQKDEAAAGTSSMEMLHLANHLYVLNSYDVPGAVLECGCFKGFSSCCLSHACAFLSRELIVADSFQGLPTPVNTDAQYYQAGDFKGTYDEVRRHMRMFGLPNCAEFVQGFFSSSLNGWNRPLAMLWMDVDLYQSTMDVLDRVFSALDPHGAMFCHEFSRTNDICAGKISSETGPPGAIREFLTVRGVSYTARHVIKCEDNYSYATGMVTFATSVANASPLLLEVLERKLPDRDLQAKVKRVCRRYYGKLSRFLVSSRVV